MADRDVNKFPAIESESFTELLGQLTSNSAAMVRNEIELVIHGFREKARSVYLGVLIFVTGALTIFSLFIFFCAALFVELTSYFSQENNMNVENNKNKADRHSAVAHTTMEQGAEILEKAGAAANDTYNKTAEAVGNAYNKTSKAVSGTYGMVMGYSSENPGKTILISLGLGAGVAFLLGSGSRRLRSDRFARPVVNAIADIAMVFFH